MAITELEAQALAVHYQVRAALKRLLRQKQEVLQELDQPTLSVLREEQLKSALAEIVSQVNQFRFSGTF